MENIYITWHYTTHGIAYLKHLLSAFYHGTCTINSKPISCSGISQETMNEVFDKQSKGFLFDKIYYLTAPQSSFDKISSRRFYYRKNILEDKKLVENNLVEMWTDVVKQNWIGDTDCLTKELNYVQEKYPTKYQKFKALLWRDMQHYPLASQVDWFCRLSNAAALYAKRFEAKYFDIDNLRDAAQIAQKVSKWVMQLPQKHPYAQFIINVALGSNETQVVWHILAETGLLPPNTKLLLTYDNKSDMSEDRFKEIEITEVPLNLITSIKNNIQLFDKPISDKQKMAELKFQSYLNQGFAILILGERGIGKTRIAEKYKGNKAFVSINCASLEEDSKAESELFGHEKGAFTGADKRKDGLFHHANDGILFLDEFHHLSKGVQAKLMKTMQTDERNYMEVRRMGENTPQKVRCQIIMASNKTIHELRSIILPDFYDRISQLVVELPPLRETPENRVEDWKATWQHMKFNVHPALKIKEVPTDKALVEWLQSLALHGNYRDLQKIAISYHTYLTFGDELKQLLPEKSPLEFARSEFRKYHSLTENSSVNDYFLPNKTTRQIINDFKKNLAEWAINLHNGAPNAEKYFNQLGDTIKARTLYQWKNGK